MQHDFLVRFDRADGSKRHTVLTAEDIDEAVKLSKRREKTAAWAGCTATYIWLIDPVSQSIRLRWSFQ